MHGSENLEPYSFDNLVSELKWIVGILPDNRRGSNTKYSIADAALSAFSVFFMQSPSFLAHQMKLQQSNGTSNAETLFQIKHIPSDNQIRNILDPIHPSHMHTMFDCVFKGLNSVGYFEHYRSINKNILIALDGVNYFSSHKISCEQCNTRQQENGDINYMHNAITPIVVAPNNPRVISLAPEFITPQDGHDKQDGEHAAAKRWLKEHAHKYKDIGVTILGDDLYAHQPICEAILQEGLHFILTCKPGSHINLYNTVDYFDETKQLKTLKITRTEGKKQPKTFADTYNFINYVPIRSTRDSLLVNWCELVTINMDGEIVFINSYITDHLITKENVQQIVQAGRTRWKCENENNNVLKNHGYNMEHNFGHGKQYLSQLLLSFNILAFLFHTVLDIMDINYQTLRQKLPTRKIFFEHIKTLTMYMIFSSWEKMLKFMLAGLEKKHSAEEIMRASNHI